MTNGLADPKDALAGATPYLRMFGTVVGGWLMALQALAARTELATDAAERAEDDRVEVDTAYLNAKITTARFYAEQLLPQAAGLIPAITAGVSVLYDVDPSTLSSV